MIQANFIFIVQGEGRGHMTQAISIYNVLKKAGHKVSCVLIGKNPNRKIPDFVRQQINAEIVSFESPNFVMDEKMKSIQVGPSIVKNISRLGIFNKSLRYIHQKVKEYKPDVIINFYDPLAGLYNFLYHPSIPMVCVAHQYIYHHPGFEFPSGRSIDKMAIKFYTRLTSLRAAKKLALSFYPINDNIKRNIIAFPPLLRQDVFEQEIQQGDYLLAYLVNSGYMEEIIKWHNKNPTNELHCFTDKEGLEVWQYDEKLYFHKLDDKKFLQMMAQCKGLVSTAGFESVCEAMYLGKPVFMVPVQGHYEQYCNARDAHKAGAGLYDTTFNIDRFLNYLPEHKQPNKLFRQWVNSAEEKFLEEIDSLLVHGYIPVQIAY